jgi:hypothetical protein
MSKGGIFISYRRDDSAGYARAIYNQLVKYFSEDRIFMDAETIEPGLEFDKAIQLALDHCDIFLAIIGKHWLGKLEENNMRINDPNDFVRAEISIALSRDIRVIPILLDGTPMPDEKLLPEPLIPLVRRHAFEINSSRFNFDLDRLIKIICKALGENSNLNKPMDKRYYWLAGGLFSGVLVGIFVGAPYFQKVAIIDSVITILNFAGLGLIAAMLGYRKFAFISAMAGYIVNVFHGGSSDNNLPDNIHTEEHTPDKSPNDDDNLYIANVLSDNDIEFDFDGNTDDAHSIDADIEDS